MTAPAKGKAPTIVSLRLPKPTAGNKHMTSEGSQKDSAETRQKDSSLSGVDNTNKHNILSNESDAKPPAELSPPLKAPPHVASLKVAPKKSASTAEDSNVASGNQQKVKKNGDRLKADFTPEEWKNFLEKKNSKRKKKADYSPEEWEAIKEKARKRMKNKADCSPEEWQRRLEMQRKNAMNESADRTIERNKKRAATNKARRERLKEAKNKAGAANEATKSLPRSTPEDPLPLANSIAASRSLAPTEPRPAAGQSTVNIGFQQKDNDNGGKKQSSQENHSKKKRALTPEEWKLLNEPAEVTAARNLKAALRKRESRKRLKEAKNKAKAGSETAKSLPVLEPVLPSPESFSKEDQQAVAASVSTDSKTPEKNACLEAGSNGEEETSREITEEGNQGFYFSSGPDYFDFDGDIVI